MESLHKTVRNDWEALSNEAASNPGLLFYAYYKEGSGESKHDEHLGRMTGLGCGLSAQELIKRRQDEITALRKMGYEVRAWQQTLITRLAAGLGIESPTENGFTFDHTHGLPILPGSVLKGISQDQMLEVNLAVDMQDAAVRWKAKNTPEFIALFGLQTPLPDERHEPLVWAKDSAVRGHVILLDALPVPESNGVLKPFDMDIMNPHYQPYYSSKGSTPPADYHKPNPIKFLTVKEKITYIFTVAALPAAFRLKKDTVSGEEADEVTVSSSATMLADEAAKLLTMALQERGVGGKTLVGYGYFGPPVQER